MIRQELNPETCRWRKTEEGSDAGNTDCGNRVDSKQRSVTACSTVQKNRRYVFTPMLSGLRWPGQTVMGSWPPALNLI